MEDRILVDVAKIRVGPDIRPGTRILKLPGRISRIVGYSALLY